MSRTLAAVAVLVPLLLAGCSAPSVDTRTATATATAAPLPADDTDRLAPGLTADGVVDPRRLTTAHADHLAVRSFTVRRVTVRRAADGDVRTRYETTIRTSADKRRFHYLVNGTNVSVERFADGRRVYERRDDGARLLREADGAPRSPRRYLPGNATGRRALSEVLGRVTVRVAGRTDDPPRYRLVTTTPGSLPPIENLTLTATVAPSGLIESYRVAYEVTRGGTTMHVETRSRITAVGNTTVDRPAWADRTNATTPA